MGVEGAAATASFATSTRLTGVVEPVLEVRRLQLVARPDLVVVDAIRVGCEAAAGHSPGHGVRDVLVCHGRAARVLRVAKEGGVARVLVRHALVIVVRGGEPGEGARVNIGKGRSGCCESATQVAFSTQMPVAQSRSRKRTEPERNARHRGAQVLEDIGHAVRHEEIIAVSKKSSSGDDGLLQMAAQ